MDRSAALCSAGPGSLEAGRDRADSGSGASVRSDIALAGSDASSEPDLRVVLDVSYLSGRFGDAQSSVQIRVYRDATVGQLKAKLAEAQSEHLLPPRFWDDKLFCIGMPPAPFDCRDDYVRIMSTAPVRAALERCSDSPPTLSCSVVVCAAEAPEATFAARIFIL